MKITAETLKRLQQIELNMLKIFIQICEKENLHYYLIGGTLLGAVRHKGFIPWDDDIDVGMPRVDYEKFLLCAPRYLPKRYILQTYKTNKTHPWPFAKMQDRKTIYKEDAIKHLPVVHGIWIDIFPLDYCIPQNTYFFLKLRLLRKRSECCMRWKKSIKTYILQFISYLFCPSWEKAAARLDELMKSVPMDTGFMSNLAGSYGRKEIMPTSWFQGTVQLEFEGVKVLAPVEYHKYLTHIYGDYMQLPPEERRVSLHCPSEINLDVTDEVNKYSAFN